RHRNVGPDAVDNQSQQQKSQTTRKVAELTALSQLIDGSRHECVRSVSVDQDLLSDGAAGSLDGSLGTCRRADALERHLLAQLAGLDDLDHLGQLGHEAGLLEGQNVDLVDGQRLQVSQADFGVVLQSLGLEATLGQTT